MMRTSQSFRRLALTCAVVLTFSTVLIVPRGLSIRASASSQTVFGPEVFRREEGKPQLYVRRFNVTGVSGKRFSLEILNGEQDDSEDFKAQKKTRVSDASVSLNDSVVVSSENLDKDVRRLSVPVTLAEGENTLKVQLRGSPVSRMSVEIVGVDAPPPPDIVPPRVIAVEPANGATDVEVDNTTVHVTFSEPISLDTLSASSFFVTAGGHNVSGSIDLAPDSAAVIFTPAAPLAFSTVYTVNVTSAIKDIAGNALAPSFSSVFTTKAEPPPPPPPPDLTPPRVISLSPQAGTVDNQNSAPVIIGFSEPVDASTVTNNVLVFADTAQGGGTVIIQEGGSFIAVPNGERVEGTVEPSANGTSATFSPTRTLPDGTVKPARLPASAMITVVVLTRVQDLAGNKLDQDSALSGAQLFNASFSTSAFNLTGSTSVARVNPQSARLVAALIAGDEALVSGGFNELDQVNDTAEIYNAADCSFRSVSMIEARAEHTTTVLDNGQVLITGGIGANGQVLSSAEIYDPQTGAFTRIASMITPRFGHTATLLPDGSVLIAGGYNSAALDSAEVFIPASSSFPINNTFVEVPARMRAARAYHTATSLQDGSVLIAGGATNGQVLDTAEVFVPTSFAPQLGQFVSGGVTGLMKMSASRFRHTATILSNGQVLVTGGKDNAGKTLQTAELFTPSQAIALSTFSPAGSMTQARANHSATMMPDGSILIAGGASNANGASGTAEVYRQGQFSQVSSPLSDPRSSHAAVLLSDGTTLLSNGENNAAKLKSAETYTPRR